MAKMPLAEHDNVVKAFPPDRTDPPFTISVLPRRSRRGWPIPNAHRPKAADEDVTVNGVAVTNDVSRRYFPTIGLGELARNPFSRWVRGHSQPQDLAASRRLRQRPPRRDDIRAAARIAAGLLHDRARWFPGAIAPKRRPEYSLAMGTRVHAAT
jgi:hypothetical protein